MLDRIRAHLIGRDKKTETHAAAMELLQERGFTYSAARKWLQRHPCNEALTANTFLASTYVEPVGVGPTAADSAGWLASWHGSSR